MGTNIVKAKLNNKARIEATYIDKDGNWVTVKGIYHPHNDLVISLSALVPYFALYTEQKEADSIDWEDVRSEDNRLLLAYLLVNGVTKTPLQGRTMMTISGTRMLKAGDYLAMTTPGLEVERLEKDPHGVNFLAAVNNFFAEVEKYIFESKYDRSGMIDYDAIGGDPFANPSLTDNVKPIIIPKGFNN